MKKKPILKAKLWRKGRTVYFQVLEQDDNKIKRGGFEFKSQRTGMSVCSDDFPELSYCTIYLRGGDKTRDNEIVERSFSSLEKADGYYQRCKTALTELTDYLNSKPKKIPATESVIIGG
jgi:hypothetical protein